MDEISTLPSIAILPFRAASTDPEQLVAADGMRVDIQSALVKISGLILIGIGTTNTYRNKDVPLRQAAAEMGVRYLLEGFVRRAGDQVRVSTSLVDGATGHVIWTGQYDGALDRSLEVQDRITEKVVTAIDVKLLSGERARVWRKTIQHPRAREHFYRGMHEFMKGHRDANMIARDEFERVEQLLPQCAIGATHVAFAHWWDAFRGWSESADGSLAQAAAWAERSLSMEDTDGQAHTVMAHVHLLRREHDLALKRIEEAVTLRPSCANANPHMANILYYCGRPAEAADRMRQAMRMAPVHAPWFKVILAASYKELGKWDDAISLAEEALRMKPDDIDARLLLVEVYQLTGRMTDAARQVGELLKARSSFSVSEWAATQPYRSAQDLARISANLIAAGLPA